MSLLISVNTEAIRKFFENPVVLSAVTSFFFAQFVKVLILLAKNTKKRGRDVAETFFWKTGGMPSSHAALVAALTMSIGFEEGITSNIFIVSFFFTLVVLRDATGVRRSSGIQAKTLNLLGKTLSQKLKIEYHAVKEVHGHTPLEVVVGSFIGILFASAIKYL
ncbi:phosphatidic acid phosphatase [Spirochaetia bacterium]|nr:phosphatidic acid phosphatase [Spirochaetia bacterium]